MGRLAGFRYRDVVKQLRHFGSQFDRHAAESHEIWRQASTGRKITLPHHAKAMSEGTLRAILRQADIEVDAFLNA